VPELQEGLIEIMKCARIPGERAKIALKSNSPRVDPIGTAVGVKGVRINSVCKELNNENIDVIEYSDTPEIFVSRAMSPAAVKAVIIEGNRAKILIAEGNKSKAIGKAGVNIRLASMLTGYEIELQGDDTRAEAAQTRQEQTGQDEANALAALFR
jgi:N utilization substance protein A